MPSKKTIIDDIILRLYQASPTDDLELTDTQVAYWLGVTLNALVATECNEKLKRNQFIPNVYIKKETLNPGTFEDDYADRVYFQLSEPVLILNNGGGIIRIIAEDGTSVNRASIQTLNLFNAMRFAKPSEANLIYTQEADNIYIEGLKESDLSFDSIEVWYVPQQDILNATDSYELLVSDLTLPMLIDEVVEIGKRELYGTQADQESDGVDYKTQVYHTAIQNPTING